MIKNKLRYILVLISIQIFFFGICSKNVFAQTDLVVEGNVLGYGLYTVYPASNTAFPVIFKVTKVIKGTEKSEYIVVLLVNLYKEYAEKNFGLNKTTTFKLHGYNSCYRKINDYLRNGPLIVNGKSVKNPLTFTLFPEVEKDSLPLKKKIPCYLQSFDE